MKPPEPPFLPGGSRSRDAGTQSPPPRSARQGGRSRPARRASRGAGELARKRGPALREVLLWPERGRQPRVPSLRLQGSELAAGAQTKTASCALAPARPLKPSFMFSEHSNYNLGCFSVLVTCPEETDGPGGTWGREATSEKVVSGALRRQGAVGAGAVCSPPACLCGKRGSGRRVLGRGSP